MNLFDRVGSISSLRELRNLVREPRHLSARVVLVNDVALCCAHELGLGIHHRLDRSVAIAALERVFDLAHGTAHLRSARLVDDGASSNLARRLLGGSCVGHDLNCPSAVTVRCLS